MSTLNSLGNDGSYSIPAHFKSAFRVVSLIEPDIEQILRAKCIRYGMRAANILASRLKTLYELFHGSFGDASVPMAQRRSQLTVDCLVSVIRMLYMRQHSANAANEDTGDSRTTSSVANHSANKYGAAKNESKHIFF